ncbi:DUF1579 family protein [Thioalkalivibrio sp. XN8]|uniref:DUF1579 family protein n=1 Tax=Thioalkalivibrio sp. XN8 TaxID=2712863 RepID=UPI0013EC9081|nr:DUF1579 family protein [Thioalkalivibrio sp. XN8]NGP53519.1 DUF1579 domain-containing protein [Thioalkalivibrio sp. XN8]
MAAIETLGRLAGDWQAISRLWLSPQDPVRESESLAAIRSTGREQFNELEYSWAFDGRPQVGRLILGQDHASHAVKAVWFDSWHMKNDFMVCQGSVDPTGVVAVKGTYAAPPGPDWGWEIIIEPDAQGGFALSMYNIPPGGGPELAVEAKYTRVTG